jgi:hypothetical protein
MDFYAGKISSNPQVSLLNDIAQIETTLGDPGARPRRPLPDPKDTHRSTHTQMALFGPTIPWYEAYNPAIAQVNPSTCISLTASVIGNFADFADRRVAAGASR